MNIKNKLKKIFKKRMKNCIRVGLNVVPCQECKKDSIAHTIRNHFDREYVDNHLLMKYDFENKKLLVSKKQFQYLLSLINTYEISNIYDMEFVEEIKLEDL